MNVFERIFINPALRKDDKGRTIFIPYGPLSSRYYIIPDPTIALKIKQFLIAFYSSSLIAVFLFNHSYLYISIIAILSLLGYILSAKHLIKGLPSEENSLAHGFQGVSLKLLWFSAIGSFSFWIVMLWAVWVNTNAPFTLGAILVGALFIFNCFGIYIKKKHNQD
jgi:hypothetical protein